MKNKKLFLIGVQTSAFIGLFACATGKPISGDAYDQTIVAHREDFRSCYLSAAPEQPKGRVLVHFSIVENGKVESAEIRETSLGNPQIEKCVLNAVQQIKFPNPPQNGRIEIFYPFKFNSNQSDQSITEP